MQKAKTLNPALLGRPLQTLDALATKLATRIAQKVQQTGHRNVALQFRNACWQPVKPFAGSDEQALDVQLPRASVHALMAARYGFSATEENDSAIPEAVSATEQRISLQLQQAIGQAAQAMFAHPTVSSTADSLDYCWQWQACLQVADTPAQTLCLTLGTSLSAGFEHSIHRTPLAHTSMPASPATLMVDLEAILLEKTFTAADIQNLHIGSVLPIALQRTVVCLNGKAMLTASVAEHQGKLHLTAFENLE